jgi:hypothetical protein
MAVVTTKSASIINWDATPAVQNTKGEGAQGDLRAANDFLTAVVGDSIGSIYRFCRIPTDAKVKRVLFTNMTAATAGAGDIDVSFSDSPYEGGAAYQALAGGVVQVTGPVDNKMFGTAQSLTAVVKNTDVTFAGTFTPAHQNLPLWQVLVNLGATQFSADPGGAFDIVMKLTTAITVATGLIGVEVDYTE